MDIDAVVQKRIDDDTDFQASLVDLSDEDKNNAIFTKRTEFIKDEFDSLSKKATDNEQKFNDQKIRAEKAEADAKKNGKKGDVATESPTLSQKDMFVLIKAGVDEDDIDDVVEFATFKKVSIAEALKSSTVKNILAEKAEIRKTAQATSTGNVRRGPVKVSDETLLANASKGEIPEQGTPEAEQLFWARRKKTK